MKRGRVVYQGQTVAVTESADGSVQLPNGSLVAETLVAANYRYTPHRLTQTALANT